MGVLEVITSLIFLLAIWGVNRLRKIVKILKKIEKMLSDSLPSQRDY